MAIVHEELCEADGLAVVDVDLVEHVFEHFQRPVVLVDDCWHLHKPISQRVGCDFVAGQLCYAQHSIA
jgi:hypothetical protein